ncbi:MAG: hypothetical protein DI626_01650 [Micavibrio aeruginosavorus]|uniref:Uncharacterized protein n=1 Tax=Micavibrio aeruginosavorus TaxID=349221 RepID=A0A2W5A4Q6_9BACT|nr:MAG: hypothetical protein DI626_01650 [Micavibrio aeruginosavorus]
MFFDPSELKAPPIAEVRQTLNEHNCLSMNPFLTENNAGRLADVFAEIADDVYSAAKKLSSLTGIAMSGFENAEDAFTARAEDLLKEHVPEKMNLALSSLFLKQTMTPYFALRDMELDQANRKAVCPQQAVDAMDGLSELYKLAKTIPIVCRKLG